MNKGQLQIKFRQVISHTVYVDLFASRHKISMVELVVFLKEEITLHPVI